MLLLNDLLIHSQSRVSVALVVRRGGRAEEKAAKLISRNLSQPTNNQHAPLDQTSKITTDLEKSYTSVVHPARG